MPSWPSGRAALPKATLNMDRPDSKVGKPDSAATRLAANVKKAQQGDVDAFREIYDAYLGSVYTLCQGASVHQTTAEDLTKKIFARAWDKLAEVDDEKHFDTWLAGQAEFVITRERPRREFVKSDHAKPDKAQLHTLALQAFSDGDHVAPARSLWADVLGNIETENISPLERQKHTQSRRKRRAIMFAVACIALLFIYFPRNGNPDSSNSLGAPDSTTPAELTPTAQAAPTDRIQSLQQEYGFVKDELMGTLDLDADAEDTSIQDSMEENLGIVEKTIGEIMTALGDDPENEMLEQMLVSTYEKQIKLLRKVVRLDN